MLCSWLTNTDGEKCQKLKCLRWILNTDWSKCARLFMNYRHWAVWGLSDPASRTSFTSKCLKTLRERERLNGLDRVHRLRFRQVSASINNLALCVCGAALFAAVISFMFIAFLNLLQSPQLVLCICSHVFNILLKLLLVFVNVLV